MKTTWKLRMSVQGMTCGSCARRVTRALESVGALDVRVDLSRGRAIFGFPGDDIQVLAAVVQQAGYHPGRVAVVDGPLPSRSPGSCC